ncbi:uncharacterized protein BX663DRAFT_512041 [Cokeromyces recurvatus]|uniref:uncharacterized protein n=1 Tax=Cokeromyces recurvatus TaxID=90255 RepID=UPI002220EE0E|nr:uncharacterized protein BX663DRAFT_512041 [Cokeromyces recurvatus]KAI7902191.1 hypothetical protein BX663DRAFT_512041 [Cokeromyces recurvatus]
MGFGLEKCCCLIPLRLGTFFIAIWFFAIYFLYSATGFLGVNAIVFYSGQAARPWYYINLLFSVFICLCGFCGLIGSCFSSRKFSKVFSVIVWINVDLSFLIYLISFILIISNYNRLVNSCQVVGFVGIGNPQQEITPVQLNNEYNYYSPVKQYPGLFTEHAADEKACKSMIKNLIILFGSLVFIIQLIQVYFAYVVSAYAKRLTNGARHHRLHDQQIKEFEESRYNMSTVY